MAPGVTLKAVPCWQVLASTVMRTPFWEANKQGLGEHSEISDSIAEILIVRRKWSQVSEFVTQLGDRKGTHPTVPKIPPVGPRVYSLTHRCVLTDQQICVEEVVGEEGQPVHLAWKTRESDQHLPTRHTAVGVGYKDIKSGAGVQCLLKTPRLLSCLTANTSRQVEDQLSPR